MVSLAVVFIPVRCSYLQMGATKRIMKTYKAKTLFSGYSIGLQNARLYVGVPGNQDYESDKNFENEKNFSVLYNGETMKIRSWKKAKTYYQFKDLKGRGNYKLAYFEWLPQQSFDSFSANQGLAQMAGTPLWEKLRKVLHE